MEQGPFYSHFTGYPVLASIPKLKTGVFFGAKFYGPLALQMATT